MGTSRADGGGEFVASWFSSRYEINFFNLVNSHIHSADKH
tara:strand:+ start:489 stop:608 length:120 start_codon:yes stop_codon:yes gene_type:complete